MPPATVPTPGPLLFARYAYGPNSLGYCGPDRSAELFGEATQGFDQSALRELAARFEGAFPYLALIARANGIPDPLDARVVDAYWIGNGLLGGVSPRLLVDSLSERFRGRLDARAWHWLATKPADGALPVHAFHVLDVFPRLGLLRSGSTDGALTVMDSCRIRWGRVIERDGDHLVVSSNHLVMRDAKLHVDEPTIERVQAWTDGAGLIGGAASVAPGDVVSIHWDWACEVLSPRRARALSYWTKRELAIANATM